MTKNERAYKITDRIFWIFIENSHPQTISDFIEADPNYTNGNGTRNTQRGRELFEELESFVKGILWLTNYKQYDIL